MKKQCLISHELLGVEWEEIVQEHNAKLCICYEPGGCNYKEPEFKLIMLPNSHGDQIQMGVAREDQGTYKQVLTYNTKYIKETLIWMLSLDPHFTAEILASLDPTKISSEKIFPDK